MVFREINPWEAYCPEREWKGTHETGAGKVAMITGGGRGIGQAIALSFAGEGASVVVSARTGQEIEEVAREVEKQGQKSLALQADVSREEDVKNMISETVKVFERVDILVNNAGTNLPYRNVVDLTLAEWNQVLEVNLTGPFLFPGLCYQQ